MSTRIIVGAVALFVFIASVAIYLSSHRPPCLHEECHAAPSTMLISNGKSVTVIPIVRTECTCLEYAPVDAGAFDGGAR